MQTICDESCDDPKKIFDGKVPLKISLGSRVQIIDSFRSLQCALAKLPKTFNLPAKKRMFPREFNSPKNQDYVGRIPPAHFVVTKFMAKKNVRNLKIGIWSGGGGLGGVVASWLVRSTPDRVVRVWGLAGDIVLCSWARHFTLTVPLSTQVYKWVPA